MKTQLIRVNKTFHFEAAHALDGYDGKCKDIHGHSYVLKVTVLGKPSSDSSQSSCGMVIDFGDIKKIVKSEILPLFDHVLVLRTDSRFKGLEKLNDKVRYVDYQPTCENMLQEIVAIIKIKFTTKQYKLHSVFLQETHSSSAEWFASDNL